MPEGGEREAPLVGEDGALRLQPSVELLLSIESAITHQAI